MRRFKLNSGSYGKNPTVLFGYGEGYREVLAKEFPHYRKELFKIPSDACYIPDLHVVVIPNARPGLVAHELSHCVTQILKWAKRERNDEARSMLLDRFTDQFYAHVK